MGHGVGVLLRAAAAALALLAVAGTAPARGPASREPAAWGPESHARAETAALRRIGDNELHAMLALLAYVDAQREHARRPHGGEGAGAYARRIDRLDLAARLGAADAARPRALPYHGYLFRILEAQGPSARNGAMEYVEGARMSRGFALLAWPAAYLDTGVRTFIVSHDGVVYGRDLGRRTGDIAAAIRLYDPGIGWREEVISAAIAAQPAFTRQRMGEAGCTVCHRDASDAPGAQATPPLAPSFAEIAARYRDVPGAEERLARIVVQGGDPGERHWKERLGYVEMGANAPRVTLEEARAHARWILREAR